VRRASFVVRVIEDSPGKVRGVVERVSTGARAAFTGKEAIGMVILRMLECEQIIPPPDETD
jgi:hypothetical protein